jgi:hypothetical protein
MSLTNLSPFQMKMSLKMRNKAVRTMAGNNASILSEELLLKRGKNPSANLI